VRVKPSSRSNGAPAKMKPTVRRIEQPKTFDHFIMNLPASATTFLPSFIGLYAGREELFVPYTERKLPMIHVYCFSTKSDDNAQEKVKICEELSQQLDYSMTPNMAELDIYDVRDVAPKKRMFCASFRLPAEVAFRQEKSR
jgi:tRNA (guanine37-N1)-methyltransferase